MTAYVPGGTSLERLRDAGAPRGTLEPAQAIAVLINSTVAKRAGYAENGKVIEGNVALAVWTAAELALPLVKALDWVYIVNGAAQLTAAAQRVLARRAGYDLDFPDDEQTDHGGTAYIRRGETGVWRKATFTAAQAKAANLLGKDNWQHYGRDMYTARACGRVISRYAPEVLAGLEGSEVWPVDPDPAEVAAPADDREPDIDPDELDELVDAIKQLPDDQREWFRSRWKTDLGCPTLNRAGRLTAAHGALARYLLDDAQAAADYAERLNEVLADATPDDEDEA